MMHRRTGWGDLFEDGTSPRRSPLPERVRPRPGALSHTRHQWDRLESQVALTSELPAAAVRAIAEAGDYYNRMRGVEPGRPVTAGSALVSGVSDGSNYIPLPKATVTDTSRYPHLDMVSAMFAGHRQAPHRNDMNVAPKITEVTPDHSYRTFAMTLPGRASADASHSGGGGSRPATGPAGASRYSGASHAGASYGASQGGSRGGSRDDPGASYDGDSVEAFGARAAERLEAPRFNPVPTWSSRGPMTLDPNFHNFHRRKVTRLQPDPVLYDEKTGEDLSYVTTKVATTSPHVWEPPRCPGRTAWHRTESAPGIIGPHPLTGAPFYQPTTWSSVSRSTYAEPRPYAAPQVGHGPPRRYADLMAIPGKELPTGRPEPASRKKEFEGRSGVPDTVVMEDLVGPNGGPARSFTSTSHSDFAGTRPSDFPKRTPMGKLRGSTGLSKPPIAAWR